MIKIRIRNAGHEIDVRFPISESELFAKLAEIHAVEGRNTAQSVYVSEVYWPEEFSALKNWYVNLDELNYLARRMESFDTLEYDQFLIGITKLDSKEVKDLINLTFNLNRFTLCQDVSSYGKIGRAYVLNTEGSVPAYDEDDPKYAAIGKELIDREISSDHSFPRAVRDGHDHVQRDCVCGRRCFRCHREHLERREVAGADRRQQRGFPRDRHDPCHPVLCQGRHLVFRVQKTRSV